MIEQDEKCAKCGKVEPLADYEEQALCQDCWHAARQATPPYHVVSVSNPNCYSHCAWAPAVYTHAEALIRAKAMNEDRDFGRGDFAPKLATSWRGSQIAHPAYGRRRRAEILAEHPEYAEKAEAAEGSAES